MADKAFIHAVKTIAELSRAQTLEAYSKHPRIVPRFGTNYKAKVTFGLHVGNSIEGSIGTDMKVDALNISSDTQIAQRIEELNENYKSQVLMTGELHAMLSERAQGVMRHIDYVMFDETQGAIKSLYTFDIGKIDTVIDDEADEGDDLKAL